MSWQALSINRKVMRLLHAERYWIVKFSVRLSLSRIDQNPLIFEVDDYSKLLRELSVSQYDFLCLMTQSLKGCGDMGFAGYHAPGFYEDNLYGCG